MGTVPSLSLLRDYNFYMRIKYKHQKTFIGNPLDLLLEVIGVQNITL